MFFGKPKKKNCWEYTGCGRQPGGAKAKELGVCPAATDTKANGLNGGKNAGRLCWAVAGTLCGGKEQGSNVQKQSECVRCNFFAHVHEEEGDNFKLLKPGQEDAGTLLIDRKSIVPVMLQAHKSKLILNASVGDESNQFATSLLGVFPDHNLIVLDELNPKSGHELLLKKKRLHVLGRLAGAEMAFSTTLVEAKAKSGMAFYKMKMPDAVYYLQLRQTHRVTLYGDRPRFRGHHVAKQEWVTGHLSDISAGGLGLVAEQVLSLENGDMLENCAVELPEEGVIQFTLVLRFIQVDERAGVTRLGGQFKDMDSGTESKISRYIISIQRKQAQRER